MSFFCRNTGGLDMPEREMGLDPVSSDRIEGLFREAFARQQSDPPRIVSIPDEEVPRPYRSLLVHDRDMTSTLQNYYGDVVRLEVLHREQQTDELTREVLLRLQGDDRPVEYGVIRIVYASLAPEIRQRIQDGGVPLGQILDDAGIDYVSRPENYCSLEDHPYLRRCLADGEPEKRFGRINVLKRASGEPLAEVIEILAAETGEGKE